MDLSRRNEVEAGSINGEGREVDIVLSTTALEEEDFVVVMAVGARVIIIAFPARCQRNYPERCVERISPVQCVRRNDICLHVHLITCQDALPLPRQCICVAL